MAKRPNITDSTVSMMENNYSRGRIKWTVLLPKLCPLNEMLANRSCCHLLYRVKREGNEAYFNVRLNCYH